MGVGVGLGGMGRRTGCRLDACEGSRAENYRAAGAVVDLERDLRRAIRGLRASFHSLADDDPAAAVERYAVGIGKQINSRAAVGPVPWRK